MSDSRKEEQKKTPQFLITHPLLFRGLASTVLISTPEDWFKLACNLGVKAEELFSDSHKSSSEKSIKKAITYLTVAADLFRDCAKKSHPPATAMLLDTNILLDTAKKLRELDAIKKSMRHQIISNLFMNLGVTSVKEMKNVEALIDTMVKRQVTMNTGYKELVGWKTREKLTEGEIKIVAPSFQQERTIKYEKMRKSQVKDRKEIARLIRAARSNFLKSPGLFVAWPATKPKPRKDPKAKRELVIPKLIYESKAAKEAAKTKAADEKLKNLEAVLTKIRLNKRS